MPLELATKILATSPEKEIEVYSGLREARKLGQITHQQLCDWMRNRFLPSFGKGVRRWTEGKLFAAQTQSFEDWIHITFEQWQKEDELAEKWISYQLLSGEPKYEKVMEFISMRIKSPTLKQRRALIEDAEAYSKVKEAWKVTNEKYNWTWR